jgi:hypothetical protein
MRRPKSDRTEFNHHEQLAERVARLQATLVDHFELIKSYNPFISYVLAIVIFIWMTYTIMLCIWMGSTSSRSIMLEFVAFELYAAAYLMPLLGVTSLTTSQNRRLYPLIASVMALDDTNPDEKARWWTIISYYYPKPMFCFTLFNSIQISWLFSLKVS